MSEFWLSLVATFSGVFVAFLLYRAWDYYKLGRQSKETRETFIHELSENQKRLEEQKEWFKRFIQSKESLKRFPPDADKLPTGIPGRLLTSAYDSAIRSGRLHLLRSVELERDLAILAEDYRYYNHLLDSHEDFVVRNLTVSAYSQAQWQWLVERISKAYEFGLNLTGIYIKKNSDIQKILTRKRPRP